MKKTKKLISFILAFAMILTQCIVVNAQEETATSVKEYIVNVAPTTANVSFYLDESAETKFADENVTDKGIVGNYHQYVLKAEPGTYYFRGTDGETALGGMPLKLDSIETPHTLLRANYYTTNASITAIDDFSVNVVSGNGQVVTGDAYISSGRVYVPMLVEAAGNAILYNFFPTLKAGLADDYTAVATGNKTFTQTLSATQNITFTVSKNTTFKLTVPEDSNVDFYNQMLNFYSFNINSQATSVSNEDGTKTYTLSGVVAENYTYRVSKEGKVTQAGYCISGGEQTVTFPEDRTPSDKTTVSASFGFDDKNILLNISASNELNLGVGETYKVRAYRAWEIVNSITANYMIEPDFHFTVLAGDDVIKLEKDTNCSGNANGNWVNVTALKNGYAIVAVSYDVIDVATAKNKVYSTDTFGATADDRYGVFVVKVGDNTDISLNPVTVDGDWDSEFDTVYYYGDKGEFKFAPGNDVKNVTVQNVYAGALSAAKSATKDDKGTWTVPILNGSNIIKVETASGVDFFNVQGRKVSYTITNNTTGASANDASKLEITKGDELTVSFDTLVMPVPKVAGVYNPGYMNTMKTSFDYDGKLSVTSAGAQYDFNKKSSITFRAYEAGEHVLTNGRIDGSCMGDPFGNHRLMTDSGRSANFNASEVLGKWCTLEDIKFNVKDSDFVPDASGFGINKVSIYGGVSAYMQGFTFSKFTANGQNVNWSKTTEIMTDGAYKLSANVTAKSYYTNLTLEYWYDGEEVHKANLSSGQLFIDQSFVLDSTKILNIKLTAEPYDKTLCEKEEYYYIVFPGSANLTYVHPVITAFSAFASTDEGNGDALSVSPAVNTATTAYTIDVNEAEKINLSGSMLQKYVNATKDTQDKNDKIEIQLKKKGAAVGDKIVVTEGGSFPTGKFEYTNLDISNADAMDIIVTSYVNDTKRTYNVTFTNTKEPEVVLPDVQVDDPSLVEVPEENEVINISDVVNSSELATKVEFDPTEALSLTPEEIAEGMWVWMEVEKADEKDMPEADVERIKASLDENEVAFYLDINLFKQAVGQTKEAVGETNKDVTITITIPEELRAAGREFVVVYTHNGNEAKSIKPVSYNSLTGELVFNANEFSTYAVAYKDVTNNNGTEKKLDTPANDDSFQAIETPANDNAKDKAPITKDAANMGLLVVVMMGVAGAAAVLVSKKRRQ